jgi:hypothetical protein
MHTPVYSIVTHLYKSLDERTEHGLLRLIAVSFVPNTTPFQGPTLTDYQNPYAGNGITLWNRVFEPNDAAAGPISSY